jgi:hypothetical protein
MFSKKYKCYVNFHLKTRHNPCCKKNCHSFNMLFVIVSPRTPRLLRYNENQYWPVMIGQYQY